MTFPSKYYTLVFLMAFSLLTHCKDDDPGPLPPATQEGRNTFGCFLNGEPYVPNGRSFTNDMDLVFDPNFRGGRVMCLAADLMKVASFSE
ncbi:MAG: hypothetical protein HC880_03770 [Bacteroidia bacterium]|nr:hypothetical protein [Bacteroidia bacterium]